MAFTNPSVSSSNLRKQLIAFALAFAPKSCCCPWGGSVRGFLHPWASFATSPCLSPQPPAPVCTLILILNHRADTACKCTEWFKLVFSVCKCSVLWLLRGTWNICSLVSDIFENSKRGRLFAAWARVACGAAGPVGEQLHIHEGKGFFLDGGQAAECRVSVSSAAQPYPIPSAQLQQSLLFKRFVWKLHYLSACLKLSLQSLVLCGLVIQRGEPGCCSQSLGKELGSREGTQSLLLPLSTSNPTFSWLPRAPYCSWWDFSVCPRAIRWLRSLLCKQDRQKQLKHLLLSPECPARLLSGEASQGYLQGWCWAWCCFHISPNGPSSRLGERRSGDVLFGHFSAGMLWFIQLESPVCKEHCLISLGEAAEGAGGMLHLLLGSQVQPHVEYGVCRQQPSLGGPKSPWCGCGAAGLDQCPQAPGTLSRGSQGSRGTQPCSSSAWLHHRASGTHLSTNSFHWNRISTPTVCCYN